MKRPIGQITIQFSEHPGGPRKSVDDISQHVQAALTEAYRTGSGELRYADFEVIAVSIPADKS